MSIHPTMSNQDLQSVIEALSAIIKNQDEWLKDYEYNCVTNAFDYVHYFKVNSNRCKNIITL